MEIIAAVVGVTLVVVVLLDAFETVILPRRVTFTTLGLGDVAPHSSAASAWTWKSI